MAEFNETLEVAVNDGLSVSFYKGLRANLPVVGVDGVYYQCTDTGELFLGTGTGMKQVTKEIDLTDYATKEDLQNVPHAQTATDLSGRVEATPEVFTYRPSAGDKSIKDDNAFIRRIKGNSIIMNQIVPDVMTIQYGTGSLADHTYTITPTGNYPGINGSFNKIIPDGHKLFISMGLRIEGVANPRIGINIQGGINTSLYYTQNDTGLTNFEQIITITGAKNYNIVFFADASATLVTIARPQIIDLTQMFGTGNEPTTVEEFRALYPNSYYPYNAGELRNLVCSGIKTIGFNEFNGTYARVLPNESYYLSGSYTSIGFTKELGGATETISIPSNRIYTPTQLGYIYATGTDICINLSHTGYRDGEYEPYKEVTHSLPLSQITNGQPLRKAGGDVYDEVSNDYYIRRVGVRSYTTGDKDDAALLTDGINTNYPLDEPIYTPIETPVDFNYYVEDFGTEEALLAEDSAPFSADIVYQFNAVDRIRQNDLNIDRLEEKVSSKAEKAENFPISLESLYAVAEGETVTADKYSIIQMLYRQQSGTNDLLLLNDEGLTVGYVVGGFVGDSLQFSAYTNDGKLIKVVASESEDELTESDVEVFDLLSSGEPNSQLAYAEVSHGTSDTTFTLTPNVFHVWDEVTELTLTLGSETSGVANEFLFQFTSGSEPTTLTIDNIIGDTDIKWANDEAPTIEANKIYQISILKGLGSALVFDNAPKVATISFKIKNYGEYNFIAEEGMTWEQWVSSEYNAIGCALMGVNVHIRGEVVGTSSTNFVTKTDTIISNFTYELIPMT